MYVKVLAKLIPVLKTKGNISKGEIKKFHFVESSKNKFAFNKQVLSFEDRYEWIWRHVSDDYFKCIGKWPE